MTDAVVQVPPDSTGKMLDAESLTVGANTVHRQRFELSGAAAAAISSVLNGAPAGTEYGLVTRPIMPASTTVAQGTSVATANLGWWMRIGASNGSSVGVTNEGALNVSANVHTVATQTAVSTSGAAVTLSIGAPGVGVFQYLTTLQIVAYAAAAVTGGATPITVTTTNLPNSPAFTFATAKAIGTSEVQMFGPHNFPGIKASAANTALTIVCPATTGVLWRVNATWYNAA